MDEPTFIVDDEQDGPRCGAASGARPGEIVQAALDLFVEKGFSSTKMDEIAKRAGVTKGTVYLYFPSKDDLFRAVVEEMMGPNLEMGERLVAEYTGPTSDLVAELIRAWWKVGGNTRTACLTKLITGEASNFPTLAQYYMDHVVLRARHIFEAALRRGVERGEVRDVPITAAARLAIAPLVHASIYQRSLLPFDPDGWEMEGYLELHSDFFRRGLAKEPETKANA